MIWFFNLLRSLASYLEAGDNTSKTLGENNRPQAKRFTKYLEVVKKKKMFDFNYFFRPNKSKFLLDKIYLNVHLLFGHSNQLMYNRKNILSKA